MMENETASELLTVHVRLDHEKHTCPMCCLELWNVPESFFEGGFTEGGAFASGSILRVTPVTCHSCCLKVIH
jgi:hypothetical protein